MSFSSQGALCEGKPGHSSAKSPYEIMGMVYALLRHVTNATRGAIS